MVSYDELHRKWKDMMADRGHISQRETKVEDFKAWIEDRIDGAEKGVLYYLCKCQELLVEVGMEADADSLYEIEKRIKGV